MRRRVFLQQLLGLGCVGSTAAMSGCGSIFHNERVHQPHSRDIDWKIAALNGLGLAFFFVPGVVAFVVDFYTGAIYLPPPCSPRSVASEANSNPVDPAQPPLGDTADWLRSGQTTTVPPLDLKPERIEEVVGEQLGRQISLHDADVRVSELPKLTGYVQQYRRHRHDPSFGVTSQAFFRNGLAG